MPSEFNLPRRSEGPAFTPGGAASAEPQRLPAPAPTAPGAPTADKTENEQKHNRADEGVYNQRHNADAEMDAEAAASANRR